jgi:hypothetical protein
LVTIEIQIQPTSRVVRARDDLYVTWVLRLTQFSAAVYVELPGHAGVFWQIRTSPYLLFGFHVSFSQSGHRPQDVAFRIRLPYSGSSCCRGPLALNSSPVATAAAECLEARTACRSVAGCLRSSMRHYSTAQRAIGMAAEKNS